MSTPETDRIKPFGAPMEHDWVEVPQGSHLTKHQGFRFCANCDRTEYLDGRLFMPGFGGCTGSDAPECAANRPGSPGQDA